MRFLPSLLVTTALLASGCSPDASGTPNASATPKAASPKTASYALTYFTMPG
jgi:hypothetical protein